MNYFLEILIVSARGSQVSRIKGAFMLKKIKSTIAIVFFIAPMAINVTVGYCNYDHFQFFDHINRPAIEIQINHIPVDVMSNFSNTQLDRVWISSKGHWAVIHV